MPEVRLGLPDLLSSASLATISWPLGGRRTAWLDPSFLAFLIRLRGDGFKCLGKQSSAFVTISGVFGEQAGDKTVEQGGYIGIVRLGWLGIIVEDPFHGFFASRDQERYMSRKHLVEQNADGVEIGSWPEFRRALNLFRSQTGCFLEPIMQLR